MLKPAQLLGKFEAETKMGVGVKNVMILGKAVALRNPNLNRQFLRFYRTPLQCEREDSAPSLFYLCEVENPFDANINCAQDHSSRSPAPRKCFSHGKHRSPQIAPKIGGNAGLCRRKPAMALHQPTTPQEKTRE